MRSVCKPCSQDSKYFELYYSVTDKHDGLSWTVKYPNETILDEGTGATADGIGQFTECYKAVCLKLELYSTSSQFVVYWDSEAIASGNNHRNSDNQMHNITKLMGDC